MRIFAGQPDSNNLVSVVIATYHGKRFIAEALESVSRQTHTNWEAVIVEDGSNDGTEQVVRDFARRHSSHRVDYFRSAENYGLGYTRNLTFARSLGKFIAILDADDRWLPDHLSASLRALNESGKDIVYSTSLMFEDQAELLVGTWGPCIHDLYDFPQSLVGRNFITPSATVFRREVITDVGQWDTFKYGEDLSYWLRCVAAGKKFQHLLGLHCYYRKNHEGALTTTLAGMMEGVAEVVARNINLPGTCPHVSRQYVFNAYLFAANLHLTQDRSRDPSADPRRAPQLIMKAWRLQPKRIRYLRKAIRLRVAQFVRPPRRPKLPGPRLLTTSIPRAA
jgi:glycosyltransferase involved in cell wall biosynthesis